MDHVCVSLYRRFEGHAFPLLVTTNVARRLPLFANDPAAKLMLDVLSEVRDETRLGVYAFVRMPDHFHTVTSLIGPSTVGGIMGRLKGRFACRWNRLTGARGEVWQSRFHERALRTERALESAVDYVHWNPVAAGLVAKPEDYRWSTARLFGDGQAESSSRKDAPWNDKRYPIRTSSWQQPDPRR
jgi:REP-associated tyrosine transposase